MVHQGGARWSELRDVRDALQTAVEDKQSGHVVSAINCYFMSQGGAMFRAQVECSPYLYLQIKVIRDVP